MRLLLIKIIISTILLSACSLNQEQDLENIGRADVKKEQIFEREDMLFSYFKDEQAIDLKKEKATYIVIFQEGICGACETETMAFLKTYFKEEQDNFRKIFVGTGRKGDLFKKTLNRIVEHTYIEDPQKVARYGLRYVRDLVFKIENGELVFWSMLPPDEERLEEIGDEMIVACLE